jgi:hypothetical protein
MIRYLKYACLSLITIIFSLIFVYSVYDFCVFIYTMYTYDELNSFTVPYIFGKLIFILIITVASYTMLKKTILIIKELLPSMRGRE